ncbi:ethanolamine ammonia-lyase reactivating factor EutA [Candidatus Gracilibacteria bacterium]|jgi:cell division protein FtsA|nr:ethanolamine ammonia-lyase reactivating factor EutA [Candidatus Gracilibacteria bacterium]
MFRLFRGIKKKTSDSYFLALDIGTDFVKALVCEANGKKGRILGVGKKQQKLGDMNSGVVTDIASVIANCHSAIREAENMANVSTKKMILGISGELVKGATNTTSYIRRDANSKIDLSELKNIVHKVQWKAFDAVRSQLSHETGYSEIDVKLVNAAIVDVRIDGYKVTNPIGFQGKEVTLSIFNAFAPLVHYGALQTIASEIDKELLAIAAEPYALTRALGYEDGGQFSSIFIDIGGGTTNVAIVRNGAVEGTKMFTVGGRTFTKRLSQSLNIAYKEAEDIKLAYSNDKLERQSNKIVREAMKIDADVWLSGVVLTLEDFAELDSLPSKILLSGGGAHLPEIKEALESREWYQGLPFTRKPQINFLNTKLISNLLDETKLLKDPQDVMPMALANLALEFMNEEQLLSKVLKKVVRLMQI